MKLFDSELKVLEILWQDGPSTAKKLAEILREQVGWSKTTTYTVIKKCVDKGAINRGEPGFVCSPLITKQQAQERETTELINKMYGGMPDQLVAAILWRKNFSTEEIERLKELIQKLS
jgi:predicted transcriptional regulator